MGLGLPGYMALGQGDHQANDVGSCEGKVGLLGIGNDGPWCRQTPRGTAEILLG